MCAFHISAVTLLLETIQYFLFHRCWPKPLLFRLQNFAKTQCELLCFRYWTASATYNCGGMAGRPGGFWRERENRVRFAIITFCC